MDISPLSPPQPPLKSWTRDGYWVPQSTMDHAWTQDLNRQDPSAQCFVVFFYIAFTISCIDIIRLTEARAFVFKHVFCTVTWCLMIIRVFSGMRRSLSSDGDMQSDHLLMCNIPEQTLENRPLPHHHALCFINKYENKFTALSSVNLGRGFIHWNSRFCFKTVTSTWLLFLK